MRSFRSSARQRLVQQQHLGAVHQCPGDGHPLLLAAGECLRPPVLKALQADGFQHFHDPLFDFRLRQLLHPQAESNVFKHVQMREQGILLENRVDLPLIGRNVINPHTVEQDVSRRGRRETSDDPQCGGLAAPTGPKQCEELFAVDIQIDVIENRLVVECHAEIPQANQLFGHVSSPISTGIPAGFSAGQPQKYRLFSLLRGDPVSLKFGNSES